ncbi:putative sodium-dependent excitatory amino acid transporter glt-3 [Rhipicephalus microplus]|uniref:putative sodium-dependent excitatory amino acid transporter glt-3 n=1 Tax=Rhipicephalus microplus TaxID=6941 RepID=UPI003F6CE8A4
MMAGLITGVVLGFAVRLSDKPWSYRQIMYIGFPGELFQRMMSGISMPLITSSVVAALGSCKPLVLRRVGLCALLLSLICKCLAVAAALSLSAFLSPGSMVHADAMVSNATSDIRLSALATDRLVDLIRNLYPSNIMRAHMETTFLLDESYRSANVEKQSADHRIGSYTLRITNQLGLLSFSVILGLVLSASRQEQSVVLNVFVSLSNTLVTATHMLMWFAPVGLCSITMALVLRTRDLQILTGDLSLYIITFLAATILHGLVVLPGLYLAITKGKLGSFFRNMIQPISMALGLASSSQTVPSLIVALEEGLQMDPRMARFLGPVGSTVNMDGTTIYLTITLIFFAQKDAMSLGVLQYITIGLTCGLASLTTAPSGVAIDAAVHYISMSFNIQSQDIGLLSYTNWMMSRISTALNVIGDVVVASGTQELCKKTLAAAKSPDVGTEIAAPVEDVIPQPH